ncbi:helix-turn-helix transcriptional regulator [Caldibacillus lycopersici]|uniref:Helix-turn-helix transcriptional regulator n=1 Tax=Perspicuibacillus lycopersici TaxID=1325689 RepID=A0AAE3ITF7_9BACI|nr:helix-turn-helix transcriptional regulator [Perspicuibacillus lycopersici]MCU9614062.1 helix-turn-helix transcriptional regulator [Perspicuibacillus lycopersici]
MEFEKEFKCRLKVIFAEREIGQGEFAKKIGISEGAMSSLTNSKSGPSFRVLYKICEELDLDFREIWVRR